MEGIRDEFTPAGPGQGGAHDPGSAVIQTGHGIEKMRKVICSGGECRQDRFKIRIRMTDGYSHAAAQRPNTIQRAGHLRRDGDEPDQIGKGQHFFRIRCENGFLRLGALSSGIDERAFRVTAQNFSTGKGG